MYNAEMFEMLAELVIDKDEDDAFNDNGSGTALVNIIKASARLGITNNQFLRVILNAQVQSFKELDIPWSTILFKELGEFPTKDATPIVEALIEMSQPLHKKLKKGYVTQSQAQDMMKSEGNLFESRDEIFAKVPDLTDYADLWLSLQLFAAKRTQAMSAHPSSDLGEQSAHSIRLIATDLVKIFAGNERWQATQMNA